MRTYDVIALRKRVQFVGQVPVTFPGTVADNLAAPGCDVAALLGRVGLDPALADRAADRLSVGEAQRMCLARALALAPECLLLDEPTSALDAGSKGGIEALVRSLADDGLTVVMVTHDRRQAEELADRMLVVERPSVVTDLSDRISVGDVGLSLLLVLVAVVISRARKADLERDIVVATFRSFAQLLAVGFVLDFVFGGHGWLTPIVLAVMIGTATLTSGARGKRVPGAYWIALASVSVSTAGTLGVLLALRIVPFAPRAAIPLGSMIISNAMNTASLTMSRLRDDLASHRREVEARLSLGQTAAEASSLWHRAAVRTGTLPVIDQTKVVGLVALPGAMTGMLLAGASPSSAIRLQLVVMYMLLGGNAFAALVAGHLTVRRLFTADHQLIRSLSRNA